jgi:hypothetical protein
MSDLKFSVGLDNQEYVTGIKDAIALTKQLAAVSRATSTGNGGAAAENPLKGTFDKIAQLQEQARGLKEQAEAIKQIGNEAGQSSGKLDQMLNIQRAQVVRDLAGALGKLGPIFTQVGQDAKGYDDQLSESFIKAGKSIATAEATLNGAAQGFALGGPFGAAAGALSGLVGEKLTRAFTDWGEAMKEAARAERSLAIYAGELEGKRKAKFIDEQTEAQRRQIAVIEDETAARRRLAQEEAANRSAAAANADLARNQAVASGSMGQYEADLQKAKQTLEETKQTLKERAQLATRMATQADDERSAAVGKRDAFGSQDKTTPAYKNAVREAAEAERKAIQANLDAKTAAAEAAAGKTRAEAQYQIEALRAQGREADRVASALKQAAEEQQKSADQAERAVKAAETEGEAVFKAAAAKQAAQSGFQTELKILEAKAAGNDALASSLERQAKLEALKLSIMEKQGVTAEQAAALAARQITAEEKLANKRERGPRASRLFSADDTLQKRFNRLSDADKAKVGDFEGFKARNSTDRLGAAARQRAREAMDAAAKSNPGALNSTREKGLTNLEKTAREQLKATQETNSRLADLGLAPT